MSSQKLSTRDNILDSAWKLLADDRPSAVRMSDIAKQAGISRQAVYLHFPSRAELLTATTRHIDDVMGVDDRLAASRAAPTGNTRLAAFIEAWGNYIPEIYGVARALMALQTHDDAARVAWGDRLAAVREGCEAAVMALSADGVLTSALSVPEATDLLFVELSVERWAHLCHDCSWTQARYVEVTQRTAHRLLVR
ncbi:MAG: TetR/AcrR family transcriptional regulator [Pseudomonadota bacterium]